MNVTDVEPVRLGRFHWKREGISASIVTIDWNIPDHAPAGWYTIHYSHLVSQRMGNMENPFFKGKRKELDGCLMWLMLVDFCGPKSDPDATQTIANGIFSRPLKTRTPPPPQQQLPLHSDQPSHQDSHIFFWLLSLTPLFGLRWPCKGGRTGFCHQRCLWTFWGRQIFSRFFFGSSENISWVEMVVFFHILGGNPSTHNGERHGGPFYEPFFLLARIPFDWGGVFFLSLQHQEPQETTQLTGLTFPKFR